MKIQPYVKDNGVSDHPQSGWLGFSAIGGKGDDGERFTYRSNPKISDEIFKQLPEFKLFSSQARNSAIELRTA
jgi:hypothetical protein